MLLDTEKIFAVRYNDVADMHSCGIIRLNDGQEVGRFSGNNFDGYRAIVKTADRRKYITASTKSHLKRVLAGYFVSIGLFPKVH